MKCDVGRIERSIRIGAGLPALGIGLFAGLSYPIAGAALAVGAVLLFTGTVGYCPLFTLLGVNTCSPVSGVRK